MIGKLRLLLGAATAEPIFIIGTDRSGTHWIARTLAAHPEVRATIEQKPMFKWATKMAANPAMEDELFPKLVRLYKWQVFRSAPQHYLDKSHPSIWFAERLAEAFPAARFVGIQRDPFATVSSMLRHKGASGWAHAWRTYPVPNRFLGITAELADGYEELPLASKCALKWLSHRDELSRLQETLDGNVLVVEYESLISNTEEELAKLQAFLRLRLAIPTPEVKDGSLDKWRSQLSSDEIEQISSIVANPH